MPNRVIKDSIKRSPQIDSLTWFEEVVFYRLIVTADDYGCMDGRIVLLKNELFPTKETVTKKAVEDAILKLVSVGLLRQYEVSGMPYLFFPTWEKHQRIRNQHRKFPEPPIEILTANCCQMTADCQSESNPIRIQSESNPNPNSALSDQQAGRRNPEFSLPLNTGEEYPIFEEQIENWQSLYPAVNIIQELRGMRGWLEANPAKRKTKSGINRFINGWLAREQNRGPQSDWKPTRRESSNPFLEILREEQG